MSGTGGVKDLSVGGSVYRMRYYSEDAYNVYIVVGQVEIDVTDACQEIYIKRNGEFVWIIDAILDFGEIKQALSCV
jgi:hypothetical protein